MSFRDLCRPARVPFRANAGTDLGEHFRNSTFKLCSIAPIRQHGLLPPGIADAGRVSRSGIEKRLGIRDQTRGAFTEDPAIQCFFIASCRLCYVPGCERGAVPGTSYGGNARSMLFLRTSDTLAHRGFSGCRAGVGAVGANLAIPVGPAKCQRGSPDRFGSSSRRRNFYEAVPRIVRVLCVYELIQQLRDWDSTGRSLKGGGVVCIILAVLGRGSSDGGEIAAHYRHLVLLSPTQRHELRGEICERPEAHVVLRRNGEGQGRDCIRVCEPFHPFSSFGWQFNHYRVRFCP